jgi:hypothetical protein
MTLYIIYVDLYFNYDMFMIIITTHKHDCISTLHIYTIYTTDPNEKDNVIALKVGPPYAASK